MDGFLLLFIEVDENRFLITDLIGVSHILVELIVTIRKMIHLNSMRNIGQNKEVKANEVDEEHYLNYDLKELNEVAQVDFLRDEDVVLVHVIPQYFIINRVALLELDVVIDELHEEFVAQVILKMPDAD